MATSKIKGTGGYKYSELTCPITGASLSHNTCWSSNKTVNLGLTISNIDIAANGVIANVPEGYRPVGNAARGIGILELSSGYVPCLVTVNNVGEVSIGHSQSAHTTSINFALTYGI